jgi:hypothetical protein
MIKENKLLVNEPLLTFQPSLAKTIGLNGAIFLQQLQYWLKIAEQRGDAKSYAEGRWWTYSSYPEWVRQNFPFWSVRTLERTVEYLEKDLHVVIGRADPELGGRKWYSIDYDVLYRLDVLPPEANMEDGALAPEPEILSITSERDVIPARSARHVRGHNNSSRRLLPRQNDARSPRQSDEGGLVKVARGASSKWRGGPRQNDEGTTRCLKGTLLKPLIKPELKAGGRAPKGAPAPLPLPPPVRRIGPVVVKLPPAPASETSMSNLFAQDQELWLERLRTGRTRKEST